MGLQEELNRLIQQVGTKEDNERVINSINDEIKEVVTQFKQLEERINSLQQKKQECNNNISNINSLEERIHSEKNNNGDISDEQLASILSEIFNQSKEKSDDNSVNAINQLRLRIIEKYILNSMYHDENEKLSELIFLGFDEDALSNSEIQQYKKDLSSDFNEIGFLRQFVSCRFVSERLNCLQDSSTGGLYFEDEAAIKRTIVDIIERNPERFAYAENDIGFQIAIDLDEDVRKYLMSKSVAEKFYRDIILPYYKEIGIPFSYDKNNVAVAIYPDKDNIEMNYDSVFKTDSSSSFRGIYRQFVSEYMNALFSKYQRYLNGASSEQIWEYIDKNVLDNFYLNECGYNANSYSDLKSNGDYSNNLSSQYIVFFGDKELENFKATVNQNQYGEGEHRNQI